MENKNLNVLDEMNKGCTMGMDAIHFVNDKVQDQNMKDALNIEYNKYKDVSIKINDLYNTYSDKKPHDTNTMNKMMTWYGVQMKTMSDKSNSNIAELLLNGTNMGIIEGRRLLNNNDDLAPDVRSLLDEFVQMQEDSVEKLKTFL